MRYESLRLPLISVDPWIKTLSLDQMLSRFGKKCNLFVVKNYNIILELFLYVVL